MRQNDILIDRGNKTITITPAECSETKFSI